MQNLTLQPQSERPCGMLHITMFTTPETSQTKNCLWYLSKICDISINDTLLTGPDPITSRVRVLYRFRKEAVAVTCVIERMFHQFSVSLKGRNYLRFLWREGGQLDTEPQEHRMSVHLFGAASSPECANFIICHFSTKLTTLQHQHLCKRTSMWTMG